MTQIMLRLLFRARFLSVMARLKADSESSPDVGSIVKRSMVVQIIYVPSTMKVSVQFP